MWFIQRYTLKAEIVEILSSASQPLSLEQLAQQLFFKREKVSELIVLSARSLRKKQKIKREIEKVLGSLDVERHEDGDVFYALRRDAGIFRAEPYSG